MATKHPSEDKLSRPKEHDTLDNKAQTRAFLGKKNLATIDKLPVMYGPGAKAAAIPGAKIEPGINVALLASASAARRAGKASHDKDALEGFRGSGIWNGAQLACAICPATAPDPNKRYGFDEAALTAVARALLGVAILGEAKGLRMLLTAFARSNGASTDAKRRFETLQRHAGTRTLNAEHLTSLVPLLAASMPRASAMLRRAAGIVDLCEGAVPLGQRDTGITSPRQLLELTKQHACLIVADRPGHDAQTSRGATGFHHVVGLVRDVEGSLMMVDPNGMYDPLKGTHDPATVTHLLHHSQEVVLLDHLAGQQVALPSSPVARLVVDAYLSSTPPKTASSAEVLVLSGQAFRYC
ncbi:MAG: hypothetical protein ABIJ09_06165 [Pseudomonadota bacterium]